MQYSGFYFIWLKIHTIAITVVLRFNFNEHLKIIVCPFFSYTMKAYNSLIKRCLILLMVSITMPKLNVLAQRTYVSNSVLASGNWFKIGVTKEGIYKIDVNFLTALGVNTTNLASASIRLYGNGGAMLPEDNRIPRPDDLQENAIQVFDGGDSIFNGNDYFLFYGAAPDRWLGDSMHQNFIHQKNLYTDTVYYFITIGGVGKRITQQTAPNAFNTTVTSFDERYFYEQDKVNLLNSGKQWLGEEFSTNSGALLTRNFSADFSGLDITQPLTLKTNLVSRSIATPSSFEVSVNGQLLQTVTPPAISGNFLDLFATQSAQQNTFQSSQGSLNVSITYKPQNANAQGWLDWFEIFARKNLSFANNGNPIFFRDWHSVHANSTARFQIANGISTAMVWDISNNRSPVLMNTFLNGTLVSFINDASSLHEYVAFNSVSGTLTPVGLGKISNQNLHQSAAVDYLMITHSNFFTQANDLAAFHRQQYGYKVQVVPVDQIYNEFASGIADPSAIRDFIKMYYDKAGSDPTQKPKYVLLFGASSFDYKNRIPNNSNFILSYESDNSLDPLNTYVSDDFFGMLDDGDNINIISPPSLLKTAVGRLPAKTVQDAQIMCSKIRYYHLNKSLGDWKNECIFVADDRDNDVHLNDAELLSSDLSRINPVFNITKIYLDAYPLVSGGGGARYPSVNTAIVSKITNGAFLFNYNGHGGYQRLADEAILGFDEIKQFKNSTKLPLFITATCDFAPFDDPTKNSLGNSLLFDDSTGAIALMTTTRAVFAFSNAIITDNYIKTAFAKDVNGNYLTLGESLRSAKNTTYQTLGDVVNNRKFTLLGDPAMKLSFPKYNIHIDSVNGRPLQNGDTLKALSIYHFSGSVINASGNLQQQFSGTAQTVLFDKPQFQSTLGNDPASPVTQFSTQNNVLFKGTSSVNKGRFDFSFMLPKDISYVVGYGKMDVYAHSLAEDANGVVNTINIGGNNPITVQDNAGPDIHIYLNDFNFRSGGLTNETPLLLVKLFDTSGINTTGVGIGHDITAVLDGNESDPIILNNYYQAVLNSYQQGIVSYQLPVLQQGKHTLKLKAWDVVNNSNEATLDFFVSNASGLNLQKVYNYPNPFSNGTTISFEHNQPGFDLDVQLAVFTMEGKVVKTMKQSVMNNGTRNISITWDGRDDAGRKLHAGTYFYRIIVQSINGIAEATQSLFIQ